MQELELSVMMGLIKKNGFDAAPTKTTRNGKWIEVVIGIGDDHTAYLTMPLDAYEELQALLGGGHGM